MHHDTSSQRRADRGFTLVELLIVIVILGILATVTVFAVRGITAKGQENAEGTDLGTIETAIDAYWLDERNNPTEAELVSAGYLTEESDLHDIAVAVDGTYTITNVRTNTTVGSGIAGTNTPTAPAAGVNGWLGTPTMVAGLPAVTYGNPSASTKLLYIGGTDAKAAWNAGVAADLGFRNSGFFLTMLDIGQITSTEVADAISLENQFGAIQIIVTDNVFLTLGPASNVQQYMNNFTPGRRTASSLADEIGAFFNEN